jgi:hypothetical protein
MKKFMLRRLGVADDPGGARPTLQMCLAAVLEQSDTLVNDVLAGLQASMAQVHRKSLGAEQHANSPAVVAALCAQPDPVRKSFALALRAAVYGGDALRTNAQPLVRFDDFQFLEEDQIDANIEFALTQQEVVRAVDDVLPILNAMVSTLLGWVTVHAHLNPLKPESFVYALRETLQEHIPEDEVRRALMATAAGILGVSLRQMYKETSDWLRSQGIEPAGQALTAGSGFGATIKLTENSSTRTLLTLDKLRRLLSGELDPGPQAGSSGDFNHTVPASLGALEDLKLVEPMMKRLADRARLPVASGAAPVVERRKADGVARERTNVRDMGRQLGEEVVRLMLENLMQDRRLLPGVRNCLQSMEPALLKLSHSDARFFSDRKHPARQFLDKITNRSLAFSSVDEPGFARFHKTFENAVGVLVGGDGDAAAYARVLRKLEEGWSRDEQQQRQHAEDAARGLLHAEQRNLLAQRMAVDFSARLEKKSFPEIVSTFLRGPWAQVVAESQLQCTDGSVDADGYMALVDDLIWSVRPHKARRNRARLIQMVPGMLTKIREGLNLISYPQERIAVFFDELIRAHEQSFDALRPTPSDDDLPARAKQEAAVRSIGMPQDAVWMAEDEAVESGYLDEMSVSPELDDDQLEQTDAEDQQTWSIEHLKTGSWVDLALAGQWVRAQLTWVSPHRSLFMFISSSGLAHSMSLRTMERLRSFSLIRMVSDGRVLDNALDAVAQSALRNDAEKPTDGV